MHITTIGIDLAKNIFQVHGVIEDGSVAFNRPLRRAQMIPFFSKLDPCLIGMEACGTSHYWGRELRALGHEVKLMPPAYVCLTSAIKASFWIRGINWQNFLNSRNAPV